MHFWRGLWATSFAGIKDWIEVLLFPLIWSLVLDPATGISGMVPHPVACNLSYGLTGRFGGRIYSLHNVIACSGCWLAQITTDVSTQVLQDLNQRRSGSTRDSTGSQWPEAFSLSSREWFGTSIAYRMLLSIPSQGRWRPVGDSFWFTNRLSGAVRFASPLSGCHWFTTCLPGFVWFAARLSGFLCFTVTINSCVVYKLSVVYKSSVWFSLFYRDNLSIWYSMFTDRLSRFLWFTSRLSGFLCFTSLAHSSGFVLFGFLFFLQWQLVCLVSSGWFCLIYNSSVCFSLFYSNN